MAGLGEIEGRPLLAGAEDFTVLGMGFDEIIDPRELRSVLLRGLGPARRGSRSTTGPVGRVGILP